MAQETTMRCDEAGPLLVPLLDGEIGRSEARLVEEHVGRCPRCARRLERLAESTPRAPKLVVPPALLHEMHLKVDAALDEEAARPAPRRAAGDRWFARALTSEVRVPRALAVAYGVALVAAVLAATVRPWPSEPVPDPELDSDPVAWADEPTASYTPEDAWF